MHNKFKFMMAIIVDGNKNGVKLRSIIAPSILDKYHEINAHMLDFDPNINTLNL